MNYSKDEFFALMEDAESQGIEHLDEICMPKRYEFAGKAKPVTLKGCGNSTLFAIPFVSQHSNPPHEGVAVRVCAVDDDMGRWPRFGGDRFGREETNA